MAEGWWTPERDAKLRRLWKQRELSQSQIGEALGCSKGAVAGRRFRLGLQPHYTQQPSNFRRGLGPKDAPRPAAPPPAPVERLAPREAPLPMGAGRIRNCLWVIGEPREGAWRYCDDPAVRGKSYCTEHCAAAFRAPKEAAAA